MNGQTGILLRFARELAEAVRPLDVAFRDRETFTRLMLEIGWDVGGLPPSYITIADAALRAVETVEALADGIDLDEVVDAVTAVGGVYRAVNELTEAPAGVDPDAFLAELAERLFEHLIAERLLAESPAWFAALRSLGVIIVENHPAANGRPPFTRNHLAWGEIGTIVSDPGVIPARVFGWGTPDLNFPKIAEILGELVAGLGLGVTHDRLSVPFGEALQAEATGPPADDVIKALTIALFDSPLDGSPEAVGLLLTELPAEGTALPGLILLPEVPDGIASQVDLGDGVVFTVRAGTDLARQLGVVVRPGEVSVRHPFAPGRPLPSAGFGVSLDIATQQPRLLFGQPDGTRLELSAVELSGALDVRAGEPELRAAGTVKGLTLIINPGEADAFLSTVLGDDEMRIPVTFTLAWSSRSGLEFLTNAGFEASASVNLNLRVVRIDRVDLAVRLQGTPPALAVRAATVLSGEIGPVSFTVDRLGVELPVTFDDGNAGPLDIRLRPLAPTGLGLSIAAGPVTGAGFVSHDEQTGRYSGALAMKLNQIAVRAVGVLDTRLPGGQSGFSLLVLLFARFQPGIQLGWGFELTGAGGLLAVNRRIDVDALHERFATGAAARLLAVEAASEASNLPAILREVDAIFPVADGVYVVGPTVRLRWVRLVTIDAGVFLEFPGPTRVVVLGTARATVDNPLAKGPLVQLRADFVGVLDLVRATFAFDATLVDSRLLESFPLTGDILFRAGWGDEPYTVMSVGGFHPDFHPGNLPVPKTIDRLAMSYGHPDDRIYLRFEGYFAITSNSVQFGASVEVSAKLGPFRIMGFIGFDALIRFEPFYFSISFQASVRLKWKGRTLAGISVKGTLSGPGPVKFTGRACVEVLFFDICKSGSFEIGSDAPPVVRQIPSALTALALELRDPANLRAATEDRSVVLRALPADPPVLAPTGVIWEQTRAPLGLLLERFEGTPLGVAETVTASSEQLTGEELDWFAPGSFSELSDAEALTRRSFERLPSGVRLAAGEDEASAGLDHDVEVLEFLLPAPAPPPPARHPSITAPGWLLEAVQVREGLAEGRLAARAFETTQERWRVVDVDGSVLATTGESQAHQLARSVGRGAVALPAIDQITLTDA